MKKLKLFLLILIPCFLQAQSPSPQSKNDLEVWRKLKPLTIPVKSKSQFQSIRFLTIDFIIDNTSSKVQSDLVEIIKYLNTIYFQANIQFKINQIKFNHNILSKDKRLETTIRSLRKATTSDIMIVITGDHSGAEIGKAWLGRIKTSFSIAVVDLSYPNSNKNCAGLIGHEIGHIFGLQHSKSKYNIMYHLASTYCNIFTSKNLLYLKNLSL